jgi:CRP/FNR family transcriptional regulator, cyclic AMP receptor protein
LLHTVLAGAVVTVQRRQAARPGNKISMAQVADALEFCGLLQGVPRNEVERIAESVRVQSFAAGTDVFVEGDDCLGLWILATGRLRLHHSMADGRQRVVNFVLPSSPIELGAALDGQPFSSTGTALDDSLLLFMPREIVTEVSQRNRITIRNAFDQLCREIRRRDIATAVATLKDARGRIACALLQLAQQYGRPTDDGVRIDYRLSRQDMADLAGVRLETVIRILSELTKNAVVRTESQIIEIIDVPALRGPTSCMECQFDCSVFAFPRPGQQALA